MSPMTRREDLVKRLRRLALGSSSGVPREAILSQTLTRAADEIEQLRAEVVRLHAAVDGRADERMI